jgi:hypothetical protein
MGKVEKSSVDEWDLKQIREQIGRWLSGPHGSNLAGILAAQRGPDSPSERGDMSSEEHDKAYWGRRARKASSGEAIRAASFFGLGKVGARSRNADYITLPPRELWDHYDKHMAQAAQSLGLEVKIDENAPSAKKAIWKGGKW